MTYQVFVAESALKALARLDAVTVGRIRLAMRGLADDPRPQGVAKLAGAEALYRIRVGQYRIIYEIMDAKITVTVIRIGHRKDVYRGKP